MPDVNFNLTGKTALVTGGNSGLGAQISEVLARAGARVCIVSRSGIDQTTGVKLPEADCMVADITQPDIAEAIFDRFSDVDILVNCAGASKMERAETLDVSEFAAVLNVNLTAVHALSATFVNRLRKRKSAGVIIHVSSILGSQTLRGSAAYAASKAGLDQLTRVQALEWGRYNVRVNAIAPGWFETPLTHDLLSGPAGGLLKQKNPMSRLGQAGDLDGPVLLLASDAGRYINGVVLAVDGGQLLSG